MVNSVYPKSLSQQQTSLLYHALRVLFKIDQARWSEIPLEARISLAKYMGEDVWTHLPDLLALREAALMIVRDAIARTGEFGEDRDATVTTQFRPNAPGQEWPGGAGNQSP
jgi:hypothetical protein